MFCPKCGAKLPKNSEYCVECGSSLGEENNVVSNSNVSNEASTTSPFVWGILGFFVPIAGLILFIMWKQDRPKDAKYAGIGALIFVGFYIILMILIFIIAMLASLAAY